MQLLECITEQIAGTRLPLVGVTVAAVPCRDTPLIVTLHWHGFYKDASGEEAAERAALASVPSTALQVNDRWDDLLDVDMAAMEAGWELGAWDVVRFERPPCLRPGARAAEAVDCLAAFGCGMAYPATEVFLSEAPDVDELLRIAGQSGYLHWQFRPVHGGIWRDLQDDTTLNAEGKRTPSCPLAPAKLGGEGRHRTVYRFGEACTAS